jgi:hypothetical protein
METKLQVQECVCFTGSWATPVSPSARLFGCFEPHARNEHVNMPATFVP